MEFFARKGNHGQTNVTAGVTEALTQNLALQGELKEKERRIAELEKRLREEEDRSRRQSRELEDAERKLRKIESFKRELERWNRHDRFKAARIVRAVTRALDLEHCGPFWGTMECSCRTCRAECAMYGNAPPVRD